MTKNEKVGHHDALFFFVFSSFVALHIYSVLSELLPSLPPPPSIEDMRVLDFLLFDLT